jgi:hypothetical protein
MAKVYVMKLLSEHSLKAAIKEVGKLRSSPETRGMTSSAGYMEAVIVVMVQCYVHVPVRAYVYWQH